MPAVSFEENTEGKSAMNLGELITSIAIVLLLIAMLTMIFCDWYRDYKNRKYHKNRSKILNPWSDW